MILMREVCVKYEISIGNVELIAWDRKRVSLTVQIKGVVKFFSINLQG